MYHRNPGNTSLYTGLIFEVTAEKECTKNTILRAQGHTMRQLPDIKADIFRAAGMYETSFVGQFIIGMVPLLEKKTVLLSPGLASAENL